METDATGFDGDDLVVLTHDTESDEDGDKRTEWREVINEIGREVAEIVHDSKEGHAMARDVVEELKKGEGLKEKNEDGHDESEVEAEAAENIDVQETRNGAAEGQERLMFGI